MCDLQLARGQQALPQFEGDGGDVMGAGDGRAVQGHQVGRLDDRPALRLEVYHHQLLLHQHHQGSGVACTTHRRPGVQQGNTLRVAFTCIAVRFIQSIHNILKFFMAMAQNLKYIESEITVL